MVNTPTCPECDRLRIALVEADTRNDREQRKAVLAALLGHKCQEPQWLEQLFGAPVKVVG